MPSKEICEEALDLIKCQSPIGALQISKELGLTEKQARTAIDQLRYQGHPVWNDPDLQAFWWSDEYPLGQGGSEAIISGKKR